VLPLKVQIAGCQVACHVDTFPPQPLSGNQQPAVICSDWQKMLAQSLAGTGQSAHLHQERLSALPAHELVLKLVRLVVTVTHHHALSSNSHVVAHEHSLSMQAAFGKIRPLNTKPSEACLMVDEAFCQPVLCMWCTHATADCADCFAVCSPPGATEMHLTCPAAMRPCYTALIEYKANQSL